MASQTLVISLLFSVLFSSSLPPALLLYSSPLLFPFMRCLYVPSIYIRLQLPADVYTEGELINRESVSSDYTESELSMPLFSSPSELDWNLVGRCLYVRIPLRLQRVCKFLQNQLQGRLFSCWSVCGSCVVHRLCSFEMKCIFTLAQFV